MNDKQPLHTRGPWQVLPEEADKDYIRIRGTIWGGRYKVANVPTPVYEGVHPREVEETRANAALIAAAPELLAALESMFEAEYGYGLRPSYDELVALIAKAKNQKGA